MLFDSKSLEQENLLNEFIIFSKEYLKITEGTVELLYTREKLVTTASYGNKVVRVYVKDRALVDVMRSIAHELTHLRQDLQGRLNPKDFAKNNAEGSEIENEANSIAGILIRKFGKLHPEIYD